MSELFSLENVKPELRKVLAIGEPGTGKTHFIGTFPRPILMYSFDGGYRTLAGQKDIDCIVFTDVDRQNPQAFEGFEKHLNSVMKSSTRKYQTIALDNFSQMSQWLFDHIQFVNGMVDKKATYTEYQLVKSKTQDILNRCVSLSEYVIVTALLQPEQDELTGMIFKRPDMIGSIRTQIASWFDGVVYMTIAKNETTGNVKYSLLTVGGRQHIARLRIPSDVILAPVEEPDFIKLMCKIQSSSTATSKIENTKKYTK